MKKIYILMAVCFYAFNAWADAGIWGAGVTIDGTTYDEPFSILDGKTIDGTQGSALTLSFAYVKTYKNSNNTYTNVCSARVCYRVYLTGGTAGSFTCVSLPTANDISGITGGAGDQQWQGSPNVDLASGLAPGSYKIEIYYEATVGNGDCSNTTTVYYSNGGSNYIADLNVSAPAPITLTHFTTRAAGQSSVELTWATATEHNNSRFEVEHTTDMERWKVIGTQAGSGNSNATRHYTFTHEKVAAGANYYRLRQIDYDGKSAYSPVRKVLLSGRGAAVVSPNPVVGTQISLYLNKTATGSAHIRLFDALGRQVQAWEVEVENDLVLPLDLSNVPAGLLFLQVNEETPIRVVKE